MARKREEFGLPTELEDIDQKWIDLYWDHYTHVYRLDSLQRRWMNNTEHFWSVKDCS